MSLLIIAMFMQAAPVNSPPSEAQTLGRRLAASGPLSAILPLVIEKDLGDLSREDKFLTAAERERLLAIGRSISSAARNRLTTALGNSYAKQLSLSDLRILVAQNESAVTRRWHAAEPRAIVDAMRSMGELDLKKSTAAAFCKETGKLCHRD